MFLRTTFLISLFHLAFFCNAQIIADSIQQKQTKPIIKVSLEDLYNKAHKYDGKLIEVKCRIEAASDEHWGAVMNGFRGIIIINPPIRLNWKLLQLDNLFDQEKDLSYRRNPNLYIIRGFFTAIPNRRKGGRISEVWYIKKL